jgi:hypothetical protein
LLAKKKPSSLEGFLASEIGSGGWI